ncbi:hypothetical protein M433DRAFT_508882 [Acidomyces richmondensis BFW]|nr:MAG: hypothetical protein FE78DRAFT_317262 [Acidomyces sp. 'richmondensis']KYG47240.1 hypothetical protein M433DRAFT_508882 [Acidomyces richmondensis BFW]
MSSKRKNRLLIGLRLAKWAAASHLFISLSPSTRSLAGIDILDRSRVEHDRLRFEVYGACFQGPIRRWQGPVDIRFATVHKLILSILILDASPII